MNKVLILLDYGFPYGTANETFLEHEIKFLSDAFDRIYIYTINSTENQQRTVPSNVHLQKIDVNYSKLYKLSIIIKFILSPALYKELKDIVFLYKQRITRRKLYILFQHYISGHFIFSKVKSRYTQKPGRYTKPIYLFLLADRNSCC